MAGPGAAAAGLRLGAIAVLCLALSPWMCAAKEFVVTLTASNFEAEVTKADFIVVEFYAPWCGHCKSLAPEYEKAAKALAEAQVPVVLAKVDADASANKALAQRFGVQGFPTLKIFRKGDLEHPQDYKGPREADGIISFLKKQAGSASQELQSSAEIKELLESESVVVVGVFGEKDTAELANFKEVADALRSDFVFRYTSDASLLPVEHPKLEATPAVRLLTTFDEGFFDTTELEAEALTKFVQGNAMPTVIEFSQDPKDRPFLSKAFERQDNKVLLFFAYNLSDAAEWRQAYAKLAKTRPEGLTFIIGEASANDHALKYFGIDAAETPAIIVHDPKGNSKYYRTNIEIKDIDEFVASFLAGTEEKKLKSEPVPEKNDEAVKVLVGKNFQELVLDSGKNVLIEFYAPWCGHCKKLEPIYKKVAESFKSEPDIVIAKMDYTANDLPGGDFKVEGFPTIYFYTSTKQIVPYKGDRSKKDLIDFVKEQKALVAAGKANSSEQVEPEELAEALEAAAEAAEGGKDEL